MANPQKEHGFTQLANELLEALCRTRIAGEARQVLDTVIRQTYGYGRTEDLLALSQICDATGLPKIAACKAIAKLKKMRLIVVTQKGNKFAPNTFRINKDWETWEVLPKKVTSKVATKKGKTLLPKKRNTKESSIYLSDTNKPTSNSKERATPRKVAQSFFEGVRQLAEKVAGPEGDAVRAFLEAAHAKRGGPKAALWAEVKGFASYWTEMTHDGRKARWECQKTFEVARRLDTWLRRASGDRGVPSPHAPRGKQIIGL